METWMKVIYALGLGAMVVFMYPRAKAMIKHGPKAKSGDWRGVIIPLLLVILFIIFLIQSVR
jgi:hypothetical protein